MSERYYYVYILTNSKNTVLYTGVTNNLLRRVSEHKTMFLQGFTQQYSVTKLVYFEEHEYVEDAIAREKQIKKWKRAWKIRLIEEMNPYWRDLYPEVL